MKPEEIRTRLLHYRGVTENEWRPNDNLDRSVMLATGEMLIEIAAQLAEHNAHMERMEFLLENVISLNCGGLQVKVNQ